MQTRFAVKICLGVRAISLHFEGGAAVSTELPPRGFKDRIGVFGEVSWRRNRVFAGAPWEPSNRASKDLFAFNSAI